MTRQLPPSQTAMPRGQTALQRVQTVLQHAFASVLPPLVNVFVSMLIVRSTSAALWGAVVDVVVMAQLGAHVIAWGNKEHLLRALSVESPEIGKDWRSSLATRTAILAPPVVVLVAVYGLWSQGWGWAELAPCLLWIAAQVLLQSLDVVVLFHKRFTRQIVVEALGSAATLAVLALHVPEITPAGVLWLLALATAAKALALRLWLRDCIPAAAASIDSAIVRGSVSFFLLGLTGLLGSRIDLYCVAASLPHAEVGRYQTLMNMLLYLQALSNFILLPFVRELYGLKIGSILSLAGRFFALGTVVTAVGIAAVWAVMRYGYKLPVSDALLWYGYGYVVQMYLGLPLIYGLYKVGRESLVLRVNIAVVVLNFAGNLALIPVMGLEGALLSSFVVQSAASLTYLFAVVRLR